MRESEADLRELQALLDRSYTGAGRHLRAIFDEEHRATAADVADRLQGIFEIHLSVLAGDGAPLVAPIDAIFVKGKFWFSLAGQSLRSKLLLNDPRLSASYTHESFAVIIHGTARLFDSTDAEFEEVDTVVRDAYVARYGEVWLKWKDHLLREQGPGLSAWIDPRVLFAKR